MMAVIPLNLDRYLLSGEVDERQVYARCFRGWRRTTGWEQDTQV